MADEQNTDEVVDQAVETAETDEPNDAETNEDGEGQEPERSVEDYESELKKLRREAAGWRTKLRETEERFKGAKTVEEFESATATLQHDFAETERSLLCEVVAAQAGLPEYLAKKLSGSSREELEADAAELAKLVVTKKKKPAVEPTGGLDPSPDASADLTPEQVVEQVRKNRY